jgi:hypothetical protein
VMVTRGIDDGVYYSRGIDDGVCVCGCVYYGDSRGNDDGVLYVYNKT